MKTENMKPHTPVAQHMQHMQRMRPLALAVLVLAAASASSAAFAQTSVPTPQSVAPNYRPPQTGVGMASQQVFHYVEPHANTWDFYLTVGGYFINGTNMSAQNVRIDRNTFADGSIKIKFSDSFSFGFGVGYNITEQLSVHGMFVYANPDYDATFTVTDPLSSSSGIAVGDQYCVRGSADVSTGDIAVRYDFLQGRIRPFVQGSIGFMYVDTGIANGPTSWWWDGWYWGGGYSSTPTVNHTYFTLGATAGLNYYFTDRLFGVVSYTANWANTPRKWMLNQRIGVSIGWNL